MGRKPLLLLLLALAILAVAFVLTGGNPFGTGDSDTSRDEADGDDPSQRTEGEGEGASGTETGAQRTAVLFGRPRAEQVGRGGIEGRVADMATSEGVVGANLILAGTGFDGEDVALRGLTTEGGLLRFQDVPAGDAYDLSIEAEGLPSRTLPGVSVSDGKVRALGTVWLGRPTGLEGRVVDLDDRPVAGAEVRLHVGQLSFAAMLADFAELFAQLDREPEPLAQTRTRANGTFGFEAVDPGALTVVVRAPGYAHGFATTVVTAESEQARELVIRLRPGSIIAGVVVQEDGRPVSGARVAVFAEQRPMDLLYGRAFVDTGPDGTFRIDTASGDDTVNLLIAAPGYPTTIHHAKLGETDVRVVLRAGATLLFRLETEKDDPVADARILVAIGDAAQMQGGPGCLISAVTDADGRAVLNARTGFVQMVMTSHSRFGAGFWMGANPMVPGQLQTDSSTEVKAGRQELAFRLAEQRVVVGRVSGPDDESIVGARISSMIPMLGGRPAVTDESGRYRMFVAASLLQMPLTVQAAGYVSNPMGTMGGGDTNAAGEIVRDISMARAAVVTGRVLNALGAPLAGARVRGIGGGQIPGVPMFNLDPVEGISGRDGRYVLDGLPAGADVRVIARCDGYLDTSTESFSVGAGALVRAPDLRLASGGRLRVIVTGADGRPAAGARVEVTYEERDGGSVFDFAESFQDDASGTADAQGRFLVEDVPPGEVTIVVGHEDHARRTTKYAFPEDAQGVEELRIRLEPGATLSGRVVTHEGRAAGGAMIRAATSDGDEVLTSTMAEADGTFRLERLPAGALRLSATSVGLRWTELEVVAPSDNVVLELAAPATEREARRAELNARLQDAAARLGAATSDEERRALQQELGALSNELSELQAEELREMPPPMPVEPVPDEPGPIDDAEMEEIEEDAR